MTVDIPEGKNKIFLRSEFSKIFPISLLWLAFHCLSAEKNFFFVSKWTFSIFYFLFKEESKKWLFLKRIELLKQIQKILLFKFENHQNLIYAVFFSWLKMSKENPKMPIGFLKSPCKRRLKSDWDIFFVVFGVIAKIISRYNI